MAIDLFSEACKIGIIDKEISAMVDDLIFGATIEIGGAILTLTMEQGGIGMLNRLFK